MAEDEDGVSNRKSQQNSNNAAPSQDNEQNTAKPDLGIEEAKYNSNENGDASPTEPRSSTSKSTGATRKDENPFSFRHFLKRDLSLPGNSTYESTGARPKVYANTVQHSPTKLELHVEPRRDKARAPPPDAPTEHASEACTQRTSDNTSSSSSVDIPFSVVDNSESKHNLYVDSSDVPFYHRPNLASEPLGMPSLPDFVQDHILVEQAFLNSNGPISVDLDNLPDFTFNTNFNAGSSSSLGRRNNSNYSNNRSYDYEAYMGAASRSADFGSARVMPLDLPAGAEAAGLAPLDPPHLSLDLTESVNPADRRNVSPRNTFPLDLPPNAGVGAESMRLPDFLPAHPGRTSPEPAHQDDRLRQVVAELERTRSELFTERSRRSRVEGELTTAREAASLLRAEVAAARAAEAALRARLADSRLADRDFSGQLDAAASRVEGNLVEATARATEADATVAKLRKEIKKLKEELGAAQGEARALRGRQGSAAADLRHATHVAETSLRDLLAGLEQLRGLSATLDNT